MRKGLPATCPNTNVKITGDLLTNVKMRSLTLGFVQVYRDSPSKSVRDMIAAFYEPVKTVEAAEPAEAAALEPAYVEMVGRYKYFELHAPTLSGAIEKFANPVNGNWDVHNPSRDENRYNEFYRRAKYYGVRVEVRSAVPHEALPPFSVMLELYETFTLSTATGERGFDRGEVLRGDAGEFDRNRAKYDEVRESAYLSVLTQRAGAVMAAGR